jgi:hypothetical protein
MLKSDFKNKIYQFLPGSDVKVTCIVIALCHFFNFSHLHRPESSPNITAAAAAAADLGSIQVLHSYSTSLDYVQC